MQQAVNTILQELAKLKRSNNEREEQDSLEDESHTRSSHPQEADQLNLRVSPPRSEHQREPFRTDYRQCIFQQGQTLEGDITERIAQEVWRKDSGHILIPAKEFDEIRKAMADMAQEIENLKTVQVNHRQEHRDEVESRHQVPRSLDPPTLKVDLVPPLRLAATEETPALNDGLAKHIAEEVLRKISGEYIISSNYDRQRAQKRPFHLNLLLEPESQGCTRKQRHDNKVFHTASESGGENSSPSHHNKYSPPHDSHQRKRSPPRDNDPRRRNPSPSKFIRGYVTLNTSRDVLYDKLEGRADFPMPKPLDERTVERRRNTNMFCKFHKDYGHLTTHCRELAIYVNNLARQGKIEQYVSQPRGRFREKCKPDSKRNRSRSDSPDNSDSSEGRPRKITNVIYEGGSLGENRGYSRKAMLSTVEANGKGKQVASGTNIRFSDHDLDNIMHPHEDPLIIHDIKAIPSSYHQRTKYSAGGQIVTLFGNQSESHETYRNTTNIPKLNTSFIHGAEENIPVDKTAAVDVHIDTQISQDLKEEIQSVLINNQDRFV